MVRLTLGKEEGSEKCDFKLRKCLLDLRFLSDCKKNGVIPKFLHFELANRHLKNL